MGDVAKQSEIDEEILYKEFGVNAELLIDHAWGWEPCTISEIKKYKPSKTGFSEGQVLACAYSYEDAKTVCKEMVENLCQQLVEKGLVSDHFHLSIGYDSASDVAGYKGKYETDFYGRTVPKTAGGTIRTSSYTSSLSVILNAFMKKYEEKVDPSLMIRRIGVATMEVYERGNTPAKKKNSRTKAIDADKSEEERKQDQLMELKEEKATKAIMKLKEKYGKNAILRGTNYQKGATGRERNKQVGGHKG